MSFVSVVIPCLNDADFLEDCLAALARQTRPADEIIVVDSCSTDNTIEVAESAGARVITKPLRGILAATATGFDEARGDIIARIDADTIPPTDWLERVENTLIALGQLGGVTGPGDFYGANRMVAALGRSLYIGGYFWFVNLVLGHPPLFGSNCAVHSGVWQRIGAKVHRHEAAIHDDLDISYQFEPDMTIIYDKSLRVRISARPFYSWRGFGRRLGWAYLTFNVNFRDVSPIRRHRERRRWMREQREHNGPVSEIA